MDPPNSSTAVVAEPTSAPATTVPVVSAPVVSAPVVNATPSPAPSVAAPSASISTSAVVTPAPVVTTPATATPAPVAAPAVAAAAPVAVAQPAAKPPAPAAKKAAVVKAAPAPFVLPPGTVFEPHPGTPPIAHIGKALDPYCVIMTNHQARNKSKKMPKGIRYAYKYPHEVLTEAQEAKRQRKTIDYQNRDENDDDDEGNGSLKSREKSIRKDYTSKNRETGQKQQVNEYELQQKAERLRALQARLATLEKAKLANQTGGQGYATPAPVHKKRKHNSGGGMSTPVPETPGVPPPVPPYQYIPPVIKGLKKEESAEDLNRSSSGRAIKQVAKLEQPMSDVKLNEPLRRCRDLLRYLMKQDHAYIFNEPVNPETYPNYYKVITQPMDLSTIETRLRQGHYPHKDHFEEEMRLVWKNAFTFNPAPDNFVHKMAKEYSQIFEQRIKNIPAYIAPKASAKKLAAKRAAPDGGWASTPSSSSGQTRKKPRSGGSEMSPLVHQQLMSLQGEVAELRRSQSKGQISGANKRPFEAHKKSINETPLSAIEKRNLKQNIVKLDSQQIQGVMGILNVNGQNEEDVVIDMDKIDVPTMRKLQDYVKKQLIKNQRRKNSSADSKMRRPSSGPHHNKLGGSSPGLLHGSGVGGYDTVPLPRMDDSGVTGFDSSSDDEMEYQPQERQPRAPPPNVFSQTFQNPPPPSSSTSSSNP